MDIPSWIVTQWASIAAAPGVYVATIILIWLAASVFTRLRLGDEAAAAKERSEHLKQRLADLEGEKLDLLKRLEAYGADIQEIKKDLDSRPRVIVSQDEPTGVSRDGDIWIKPAP